MKKIIYSLVIMIAAGSLFTSCVENTEPQGIKDLREAKADYLASLSKLREADAEKVKAEAAVEQAKAAIKQAEASLKQTEVEAAQIKNDLLAATTEAAKEALTIKLDSLKAAAQITAVKAEQELAQAQWDLEVALRRIAAASFSLTPAEDSAITIAADSLYTAQQKYNTELNILTGLKIQLWEVEYDHTAGYDTIAVVNFSATQLAENYKDSVLKYKGEIQRNTDDIATFEKAKESADATAEVLGTFADSIRTLQADSLAAVTEKSLYDATKLVEANKKYKELVDAFKDSIPTAPVYAFGELNSNGDTVAKKYPLSGTGDDLDAAFKDYVDITILNGNNKPTSSYGISVSGDAKNIEVGRIGSNYATEKQLDSAQALLKEIVDALSRHLVVVDDSVKAKNLVSLQKAAANADTAYWKARKALEAGLEGWDVAKDSLKKKKDTLTAKKNTLASLQTAHKNDTTDLLTGSKGLAEEYIDAVEAYTSFSRLFDAASQIPLTDTDTSKLLSAVNALGTAQFNYLGVQDTVSINGKKVAFSALDTLNDYDDIKTAFSSGNMAYGGTTLTYDKSKSLAFSNIIIGSTKVDSVTSLSALRNDYSTAFNAGVTALNSAKQDTINAYDALDAYQKTAKVDYIKNVYEPFFATTVSSSDTADALKKVDFTWSDSTFSFKKADCIVKFVYTGNANPDSIRPNNTLKIVLDRVDKMGYSDGTYYVNNSPIFKGTNGNWTLFAKAINANQLAKEAENFAFLKDQLDKIKAQYAAIVSDLKAYNAQYAADSKAYNDGLKALYGGIDPTAYPRVSTLGASVVNNGKWAFYGKQLEFANEVAADYPALVKATLAGNAAIHARIVELQVYVDTLNSVAAQWAQFDNPRYTGTGTTVNDIITTIDGLIDGCKTNIATAQQMVDIFEKAVAMAEQGYDQYAIDVTTLKQEIALSETKLAQLEAKLEIYKAQYDAVIAKYGVKDAE